MLDARTVDRVWAAAARTDVVRWRMMVSVFQLGTIISPFLIPVKVSLSLLVTYSPTPLTAEG